MMAKFVCGAASNKLYEAIHAAGLCKEDPSDVARVVVDLKAGSAARIYIEKFADDGIIDVLLGAGIADLPEEVSAD